MVHARRDEGSRCCQNGLRTVAATRGGDGGADCGSETPCEGVHRNEPSEPLLSRKLSAMTLSRTHKPNKAPPPTAVAVAKRIRALIIWSPGFSRPGSRSYDR